ncbi:MAG: L,D-transpeptidase family protein, partial [Chloroflexota bacterium]
MAQSDQTRQTPPTDKLAYAIYLAKCGRKLEARELLQKLVALQPVNQAAWLWLSALAISREEAEAALAQARQIDKAHPALNKAEQWLVKRFSEQPLTKETPIISTPHFSSPSPPKKVSPNRRLVNSIGLGIALIAVIIGLIVLFFGIFFEANATAQIAPSELLDFTDSEEITVQEFETEQRLAELDAHMRNLDQAWSKRDWGQAITILQELQRLDPTAQSLESRLIQAHLQQGLMLRRNGAIADGRNHFETVLDMAPQQLLAQQELDLATRYIEGVEQYQSGKWQEVIDNFAAIHREVQGYADVDDLLFSAYYNQGLALQAAGSWMPAKRSLEAAIALRPDLTDPRLHLAEIEFALASNTPADMPVSVADVEDRIIIVGIAEQKMVVFEGEEQVFEFVVSTGEPGRDTAIGEFEILNKIDVAYASTWNLDMPNWMGIYWAGHLQNGIHALPTVKHTGYTLWDGYLGQRVSYGCVILSL